MGVSANRRRKNAREKYSSKHNEEVEKDNREGVKPSSKRKNVINIPLQDKERKEHHYHVRTNFWSRRGYVPPHQLIQHYIPTAPFRRNNSSPREVRLVSSSTNTKMTTKKKKEKPSTIFQKTLSLFLSKIEKNINEEERRQRLAKTISLGNLNEIKKSNKKITADDKEEENVNDSDTAGLLETIKQDKVKVTSNNDGMKVPKKDEIVMIDDDLDKNDATSPSPPSPSSNLTMDKALATSDKDAVLLSPVVQRDYGKIKTSSICLDDNINSNNDSVSTSTPTISTTTTASSPSSSPNECKNNNYYSDDCNDSSPSLVDTAISKTIGRCSNMPFLTHPSDSDIKQSQIKLQQQQRQKCSYLNGNYDNGSRIISLTEQELIQKVQNKYDDCIDMSKRKTKLNPHPLTWNGRKRTTYEIIPKEEEEMYYIRKKSQQQKLEEKNPMEGIRRLMQDVHAAEQKIEQIDEETASNNNNNGKIDHTDATQSSSTALLLSSMSALVDDILQKHEQQIMCTNSNINDSEKDNHDTMIDNSNTNSIIHEQCANRKTVNNSTAITNSEDGNDSYTSGDDVRDDDYYDDKNNNNNDFNTITTMENTNNAGTEQMSSMTVYDDNSSRNKEECSNDKCQQKMNKDSNSRSMHNGARNNNNSDNNPINVEKNENDNNAIQQETTENSTTATKEKKKNDVSDITSFEGEENYDNEIKYHATTTVNDDEIINNHPQTAVTRVNNFEQEKKSSTSSELAEKSINDNNISNNKDNNENSEIDYVDGDESSHKERVALINTNANIMDKDGLFETTATRSGNSISSKSNKAIVMNDTNNSHHRIVDYGERDVNIKNSSTTIMAKSTAPTTSVGLYYEKIISKILSMLNAIDFNNLLTAVIITAIYAYYLRPRLACAILYLVIPAP